MRPLPGSLQARRPTLGDARALADLVDAVDLATRGRSDDSFEEVQADLASPHYDLDGAAWVVLDGATIVGWLWSELDDAEPDGAELALDPYALDPAVLRWLLAEGMSHADRVAAERGSGLDLIAGCFATDVDLVEAYRSAGLKLSREFWRMRVDLDGWSRSLEPRYEPAPGVTVRVASEEDADLRLLHALVTESFAGHWHFQARPYDEWLERLRASAGYDPTLWWIATVDGEPAGVLMADDHQAAAGAGYIGTLGVLDTFRRRRVAKTLLRHAFAEFAARGRAIVRLSVDAESATGATKLYEAVGMSVEEIRLVWRGRAGPRQR